MNYKILDFHTHAFPDKIAEKATENLKTYYKIEPVSKGNYDDLLQRAATANVSKIVVHSTATKPSQVINVNSYIGELVQTYPDLLIGFGTIHPLFEDYKTELARIKAIGLKGIKLHSDFQGFDIDTPRMMPIYAEIVRLRLPILFHMGDRTLDHSSPHRLANVISEFPDMVAIGAHLGGVFRWEDSLKHLVGKNLYFDTSSAIGMITPALAMEIIERHGFDKILFGTDFPLSDYESELKYFFDLPLTEAQRTDILYNNAAKLLHI